MSSGKVVLGLLVGTTAGALAGILFAPAKGSKTRRRIMNKGEKYADSLKDKLNDLIETTSQKFEKVKKEVTDFNSKP
jgi:gas vesicle protein